MKGVGLLHHVTTGPKSSPVQGKMISSVYPLAGVIREKKETEAHRLPDHNASEV